MNDILPKVTIAIPVYNGADYLREAVESALNQTYKNTEVIVLDDGSTDGGRTRDIAESFGSAIRYIYQNNTGVAGALNHIIRVMSGDVFTWLSHDDVYFPQKTQLQVEYFNLIARRDAIIFSDVNYIDEFGRKIDESQFDHNRYISNPMRALLDSAINGCTLFIPVQILREFGRFDLALRYTQDYDLWDKILTKHDFYHLPLPLIKYRLHSEQGTHRPEAVVEGDALWVRIAERRTETERALLAGSTLRYFEQLAAFLARTPYKHAAVHAAAKTRAACRAAVVTVLLRVTDDLDGCLFAAASVLRQTHRNFELLLISTAKSGNDARLSRWAAGDNRVKILLFPNAEAGDALARGSLYASGAYLAFIDAESIYIDTKLEAQIDHMQRKGLLLTWCATVSPVVGTGDGGAAIFDVGLSQGVEEAQRARLSTLMIHRNFICAGEFERMVRALSGRPETVMIPPGYPGEAKGALVVCQ